MKMTAIGHPPVGSVYETDPPENCVLFSTAGEFVRHRVAIDRAGLQESVRPQVALVEEITM